jgi:hypothetical protein
VFLLEYCSQYLLLVQDQQFLNFCRLWILGERLSKITDFLAQEWQIYGTHAKGDTFIKFQWNEKN